MKQAEMALRTATRCAPSDDFITIGASLSMGNRGDGGGGGRI